MFILAKPIKISTHSSVYVELRDRPTLFRVLSRKLNPKKNDIITVSYIYNGKSYTGTVTHSIGVSKTGYRYDSYTLSFHSILKPLLEKDFKKKHARYLYVYDTGNLDEFELTLEPKHGTGNEMPADYSIYDASELQSEDPEVSEANTNTTKVTSDDLRKFAKELLDEANRLKKQEQAEREKNKTPEQKLQDKVKALKKAYAKSLFDANFADYSVDTLNKPATLVETLLAKSAGISTIVRSADKSKYRLYIPKDMLYVTVPDLEKGIEYKMYEASLLDVDYDVEKRKFDFEEMDSLLAVFTRNLGFALQWSDKGNYGLTGFKTNDGQALFSVSRSAYRRRSEEYIRKWVDTLMNTQFEANKRRKGVATKYILSRLGLSCGIATDYKLTIDEIVAIDEVVSKF